MFATLDGTVDHSLERRRDARRCEVRAICEQQARLAQRLTEIVREADDEEDWRAAGCSSSAQWLAQVASSDYRSAKRITSTSEALRRLPALDCALGAGALTLDQVAAAAEFATTGQRCRARACGGRQAAQRDRSGCAHARPAQARGRPRALPAALLEHDLDTRQARTRASAGACRWSRARPSNRPSGTSPKPNAPPTSRQARCWSGSSRPPTRSSPSPATPATTSARAEFGAVPPP